MYYTTIAMITYSHHREHGRDGAVPPASDRIGSI
jgi:hypothetical protein